MQFINEQSKPPDNARSGLLAAAVSTRVFRAAAQRLLALS